MGEIECRYNWKESPSKRTRYNVENGQVGRADTCYNGRYGVLESLSEPEGYVITLGGKIEVHDNGRARITRSRTL